MKKGVIYKLIFGKGKDEDFTVENLPKTRVKQFGFVFRRRFGVIFRVNLLAALFMLPLLAWDFIAGAYISEFTAGMDAQTEFSHLLRLSLVRYGTDIPLLMLAFVGLAGAFFVIRKLCWCAPVDILKDFKRGIKGSFKQFLGLGFLTGIVILLSDYFLKVCLLTISSKTEFVYIMAITAILVVDIVGFVALVYAMGQASLYNMNFFTIVKSSFIITFKRLFRSIGVALLSMLPVLVFMCLPWAFMRIIGNCLIIVFSIGFAVTMQTVLCLGAFDLFINKESYPDFVGLGLSSGKSYFDALGADDDGDGESAESDPEQISDPPAEDGEKEDDR